MITKSVRTIADRRPLLWWFSLLLAGAAVVGARTASPQELTAQELEDLVSPVALYPDDVLGIILPASTFPLDVVRAARFLEDREDDSSLQPDPEWDDSIVALLNYPEVLRMMDENIDWTWELGEAVLTDQAAVLDAAQDFRSRALAAGNLQSDDRQTVASDDGTITIVPADPKVVYIPVYEPREVVIYQPAPIWHYYPVAYPVYYYPYPHGYSFNVGFFWGVTSYFSIGWHSHYVHVHHHTHYRHPYYLNSYYSYAPYYPRNHVNVTLVVNDHDNVWVPSPRRGGRPEMVSVEGRASAARMTRTTTVEGQAAGAPRASTSRMTAAESSSARSSDASTRSAAPSTRSSTRSESSGQGDAGARTMRSQQPDAAGQASAERPSTRQSSTVSGSTSTRMTTQPSTRPSPQTSDRPSARTQSQSPSSTRTAPRTSTGTAPQGSATRMAPQVSSRPAPQASTRSAPQSSAQRSMSSTQPTSGGSTRSGSSSSPRMQGTTRSGGGNGSSSSSRQTQR